jgi:hypothetical protein
MTSDFKLFAKMTPVGKVFAKIASAGESICKNSTTTRRRYPTLSDLNKTRNALAMTTAPENGPQLALGAGFDCMADLRRELKRYSLASGCPMRFVRSSPQYLCARCSSFQGPTSAAQAGSDECSFVVSASRRADGCVYVTQLQLEHSLECFAHKNVAPTALRNKYAAVLGSVATRPMELVNLARSEFGAAARYWTGWRALKERRDALLATAAASFGKVGAFLDAFKSANPGTITSFEIKPDGAFDRAFLCPGPLASAFPHCRPMVVVDGCHVRSRYGGVILSACAHDGDGHVVPLAIALCEVENEDNWRFFFSLLALAVPAVQAPGMVVIHDREKGLHNAQEALLPNSHEAICVWHLEKNVNATFKSKFDGAIWKAARALLPGDFEAAMADIRAASADAEVYLRRSDPAKWAATAFPVPRFGTCTSNSAESMNSWIESLREDSHLLILSGWAAKTAQLVYSRHQQYAAVTSILTTAAQSKFRANLAQGRRYQLAQTSDSAFIATCRTSGAAKVVDLARCACSCGEFAELQFPCKHAAAAIQAKALDVARFAHASYCTESLRAVYGQHIALVDLDTLASDARLLPPVITRKAGRPRTLRLRSRGEVVTESHAFCSKCHQRGHNVRTCDRRQRAQSQQRLQQQQRAESRQQQAVPQQAESQPQSTEQAADAQHDVLGDRPLRLLPLLAPASLSISVASGAAAVNQSVVPTRPTKRRRTVVCPLCGASHYRKTPCRPSAGGEASG